MYELTIPAMSCGHCQKTITGALIALDGNAALGFDMEAHKLSLSTAAASTEKSAGGGCHCDMCD